MSDSWAKVNCGHFRCWTVSKLDICNQACLALSNLLSNLDSYTYRQTIMQFRQFNISDVGKLDTCKLDICNQVCLTLSNLLSNLDSYIFRQTIMQFRQFNNSNV